MNPLFAMPDITFADQGYLFALLLVPILGIVSWFLTDSRTRMRRSVLFLRLALYAAVICTLAEPLLASTEPATTTIVVLDQSTSVQSASVSSVPDWLASALNGASSGDDAAIIGFGSSADLLVPPQSAPLITGDWDDESSAEAIDPAFTNMESAIALARTLPVGGNRRILLISDGAENLGSVQSQIAQAAQEGLPIDVLVVPGAGADDLRIDSVTAPVAIWQGEKPNVLVSVSTVIAGTARLELVVDSALVDSQDVTLPAGLSTFAFTVPELDPGFHSIAVVVSGDAAIDQLTTNNTAPAALIVRDSPKVLLVSSVGSDASRLVDALTNRGAEVTNVVPDRVPVQLSLLGAYDAFILDNISASALQVEQIAGLQEATRTLGKGLVVIGGTSSYGPGQYAGTRLEDLLPVSVKVTDGRQRQQVALLLIVDHSGSMAYDPLQETSKIEMAKQAMVLAGNAMADGDTIGVLSFSDTQDWTFPLTQIEGDDTRDALILAVSEIKASGGTEIYPALQVGLDAIRNIDADVRHVVLISDGKSKSGTQDAYLKLVAEAGADRTTVSTIAIGSDADQVLLEAIAQSGAGRYHFASRVEDVPRLTLEEAQSAGAQSVIRGAFQPIQTLPSPIMTGFDPTLLPPLDGYDFAEAKSTAQVILVSHRSDPVLAKWQYGLGRVVAWTADDGADLASHWGAWERFDEFWAAVLRWSLPDPENRSLSIEVERDGPDVLLSVTTNQDQASGDYVDLSGLTARITGADSAVTDGIALVESGPGLYQIRVRGAETGAYQIDFVGPDGESRAETLGFVLPGSPELLPSPNGPALMESIAESTGGRILTMDDPGAAFDAPTGSSDSVRAYRPIWSWIAIAALVLFLTELFVRLNGFARLRSFAPSRA